MAQVQLLAILGRGIQRPFENWPWDVTDDLEMTEPGTGAHLIIRKPINDEDNWCLVGGGKLNILAGMELIKRQSPPIVVFAYGDRSEYLKEADGPSESEVGSKLLKEECEKRSMLIRLEIWPKEWMREGASNTNTEIENIFNLALKWSCCHVGIVTVDIHMARSILFAEKHLKRPQFCHIRPQYFVSEMVLCLADPVLFAPRVAAMHASKAFWRTAAREQNGINCFLEGRY